MTTLHETAVVARPLEQVFDYVSDFTTTTEWDATALQARKLTPGAVGVGTRFEVICALPIGSININYEVEELQANKSIVLKGSSRLFDIQDKISFTAADHGTQIDYRAEFFFKPLIKPLAPSIRKGLERMGRESVAGLAEALEDNFPLALKKKSLAEKLLPEVSLFTRLGHQLGSKRFHPMSASIKGKHIVVTGASAGLGLATAKELARRGAQLTLIMRNKDKAEECVAQLQYETGNKLVRYELADLSLMADVESLVKRLLKRGQAIDVLVNNAGALFNPRSETAEGLEQSYALLLLSPYRLTEGLKPLLLASKAARVINVVSGGMYTQKLDVDLLPNNTHSRYSGSVAYAREKRALMTLTEEWARDWSDQGIIVNAMHPGWADTPGVQNSLPEFRKITRRVLRSAQEGADTIVWLAVASEAGRTGGKLFLDRQQRATHLTKKTREPVSERRKLLDFLIRAGNLPA